VKAPRPKLYRGPLSPREDREREEHRDRTEDAWAEAAGRWFWRGLEPLEIRSARARREPDDG
jgi:hypothetical protein